MSVDGVYLSYPIDQSEMSASTVYLYQQAEKFKGMLIGAGAAQWVFDPGDAFSVQEKAQSKGVRQINQAALGRSECVVAFLQRGQVSIGVPMEIQLASQQGKLVVIFSDVDSYMLLWPETHPRILRYKDWDDATLDYALRNVLDYQPGPPERHEVLPVKPLNEMGKLPVRTYENDAGLDLIVSHTTIVDPSKFVDVPCSIAVELPEWSWGLVTGRSSALRKRGLLVHNAIIDSGYRGPMFAGAFNLTDRAVQVIRGERIAQLLIFHNQTRYFDPVMVSDLTDTPRGSKGFGSSGS